MLDEELLVKVLKKACLYGGEYAEIFTEHRKPVSIHLEDKKVEKVITGVDSGLGIRLIYNGKSAYAYSNDFSEASLLQAASEVSKAATGEVTDTVIDLRTKTPSVSIHIKLY